MLKTTMFGSTRRPFAFTVPGIAILILLTGLLWVSSSGYQPVAADHPTQPPDQNTYTVTFTTDDQSKWGPGSASPGEWDKSLFSASWNKSGGDEYFETFGGSVDFEGHTIPIPDGTFGGAISGSTTGEIELGVKLEDFSAGGVAVQYPIEAILTTPAADSFNMGDTITIDSSFRVLQGAELATESPNAGTVSLYGTLGFTFAMDAEVCIVDCVDFGVPQFGISPTKSGNIISIDLPERVSFDSYEIAESIVNDTMPSEVEDLIVSIIGQDLYDILLGFTVVSQLATFIDNVTPLGYFGGFASLPDVETTSALDGNGTTLTASGDHDFVEIDIDVLGFFTSVPLGFELFPMCIGGFCASFNINIASVEAVTTLTQEEEYEFEARPRVMLQFPEPVVYNITPCVSALPFIATDPTNSLPLHYVDCSGTSDTVVYDLGSSIDITFPVGFSGSIMNVTPTFLLPNQISNDTVTTITESLELTVGEFALSVSEFDVVPPFEIIPEACIPGVGCTPGLDFPGLTSPEIDIDEGPLFEHTLAEISFDNDSVFDGDQGPWLLQGFNAPAPGAFQLNPNLPPIANYNGAFSLNEGQVGSYWNTATDPEGDAMSFVWDFGDGTTATGGAVTHAFTDEGTYQVRLTVTDHQGASGAISTISHPVIVSNVAPAVNAGANKTVDEGTPASLGPEFFGSNRVVNGDAENGTTGWTLSGGFDTTMYRSLTTAQIDPGRVTCVTFVDATVECYGISSSNETDVVPGLYQQTDSGQGYVCGLHLDGTVSCWGGQIWDPDITPSGTYTQITGGFSGHFCGVQPDGIVSCWGRSVATGAHGQYSPYTNQTDTFGNPGPVAIGTTFTQVAASHSTTCGIKTVGVNNVVCWGLNGSGQATPPAGTFTQISGSNFDAHFCGVKTGGGNNVACWGRNDHGESTPPTGAFVQVAAGQHYTCGIRVGGLVECWGQNNSYGRTSPPAGTTFASIEMGSWSCGVQTNGDFVCWGAFDTRFFPGPSGVPVQVDAGGISSCGLYGDGSVSCWGRNFFPPPPLNYGPYTQINTSSNFSTGSFAFAQACGLRPDGTVECWKDRNNNIVTPISGSFAQISVGTSHGCGIRLGGGNNLDCWGSNSAGQAAPPTGTFSQVSSGNQYTCALRDDGIVDCFGDDIPGQAPFGVEFVYVSEGGPVLNGTTFTSVESGPFHACGIKTDGTVACWGPFGNGSFDKGQMNPPAGTFTQVAAGETHTCGLRLDGSIECWGFNDFGQSTPPAGKFDHISAGWDHNCGLRVGNTFACWGYNGSPSTGLFPSSAPPRLNATHGELNTTFARIDSQGPPDRGLYFFYGGGETPSTASQLIDVSIAASSIDAGAVDYDLSAYLGGLGAQVDSATVFAFFWQGNPGASAFLGSGSIGPVTATDRLNQTALLRRSASGSVPSGTRKIEIVISMIRDPFVITDPLTGTRTDGYVDDVSLVLIGAGEASFTDPGIADIHTASIDWGDQSPAVLESASVHQSAGLGTVNALHPYGDNGTYNVTLSVDDGDSGIGSDNFSVTVNNVAPVVTGVAAGFTRNIYVQQLVATYTDAGFLDTHTATIDWGDGSPLDSTAIAVGGQVLGAHLYGGPASSRTITITVTDDDRGFHQIQSVVTIHDLVIQGVSGGADKSQFEGSTISFEGNFGSVINPINGAVSSGLNFRHSWDFGDGSTATGRIVNHVYADDGVYSVRYFVEALSGGLLVARGEDFVTVTVNNANPSVSNPGGSTINEGGSASVSASFSDAGIEDSHTAVITWGDGQQDSGPVSGSVTGSHIYADNGSYSVRICVTDDDGGSGCSPYTTINVNNVGPSLGAFTASPNATPGEGSEITVSATFSDPGFDSGQAGTLEDFTAVVSWGDGSYEPVATISVIETPGSPGVPTSVTIRASHVYIQEGTYTVTICVKDDELAQACNNLVITVHNVAPSVTASGYTIDENGLATLTGTISDPGVLDTFTLAIDWDDGVSENFGPFNGPQFFSETHRYLDDTPTVTSSDNRTVTLSASDGLGSGGTSAIITVNNVAPSVTITGDTIFVAYETYVTYRPSLLIAWLPCRRLWLFPSIRTPAMVSETLS